MNAQNFNEWNAKGNYRMVRKMVGAFALTVSSLLVSAETIVVECPSSIDITQKINTSSLSSFSFNSSSGLHDLMAGALLKLDDKKSEKASIIFNSGGLQADEEIEDGDLYKARYMIDSNFFTKNAYQFYCIYRDAAVTLSAPINPNYKECTVITIESDPAENKPKQVKMECIK